MERIDLDHRRLDSFAFALIDPSRGDGPAWAAWAEFSLHELTPAGFAARAAQLPQLVDLRQMHDDTRVRLLDLLLSRPPPIGAALCVALLQTEADAERMIMRFRQWLAPRFPQGRRGLFRFYDPEVFEHLCWMLSDRALARLFGPVAAWVTPLRGAWYMPRVLSEGATHALGFHLDTATWRRVQRIGAIYAVLNAEPAWQGAPAEWGPRAEGMLIRAEQHQFAERDDAVAFAIHGLRWHVDIDKHPRVVALLKDCMGHPARYRRLAGAWTDADWQAIAADLDRPADPMPMDFTNRTSQGLCQ